MNRLFSIILIITISLFALSCGDDDSNPASSTPDGVGVYAGTNSMDKPISITISNINGSAWVTQYSIEYFISSSGSTYSGTASQTDSEGLGKVSDNKFEINIGTEEDEALTGTIDGDNISGDFNLQVLPGENSVYATGSYSISKN